MTSQVKLYTHQSQSIAYLTQVISYIGYSKTKYLTTNNKALINSKAQLVVLTTFNRNIQCTHLIEASKPVKNFKVKYSYLKLVKQLIQL